MTGTTSKTVLHEWHTANGGKMVDFSGWDMPVQYPTGAIQEHLATRCRAGLFDVSHMGRFIVSGAEAEAFLSRALTNAASSLKPGEAHYTFVANEAGGAIDDAYLYRLEADRFLLVVNAGNREKVWNWLNELHDGAKCTLEDESESLCMMSLQGPDASLVLEELVDKQALPENKRNRLSRMRVNGHDVLAARTGYTGEAVCFELFVPREITVNFWQSLVDKGATPVGLGARDSLRLEAGLPLYGHELGLDPEGNEIPIFANELAVVGVRPPDGGNETYVGQEALERQREELVAIRRHEIAVPPGERILHQVVRPIAVLGSKRPIRAGFRVRHDGEDVGVVTSGTSVPYSSFHGEGLTAKPSDDHDLRPIGLALLRSDIHYRSDRPVRIEVLDTRGNVIEAELVRKNLWPIAPYTRPYKGFESPDEARTVSGIDYGKAAAALAKESAQNTEWRRRECINLIPSETVVSEFVDRLCTSDPSSRYNEHSRLAALGPNSEDIRYYKGTDFIMEKEEELKAALRSFFECTRVEPRVISGQMANDTVYDALLQFLKRFRRSAEPQLIRRVLVHDLNKGGHLSAQPLGALKNYVAADPKTGRPAVEHFPIEEGNPLKIDAEATKELIAETKPELIVFGRSVIVHKEPVEEIAGFIHAEFGKDNPARPVILYDGAHVLGLIGPHFQKPLAEGADFITGSTHKSFFGPQRGVIVSNIEPGSPFEGLWHHIERRAFPGHVSNHHLGTLLGLLGATYEMLAFKDEYPAQVIANAKAFAVALKNEGLSLEGDPDLDFTETHQVLLRTARGMGEEIASRLEASNVITNPQAYYDDPGFAAASGVRMGTQEMTRYGMKEDEFRELATLLAGIMKDDQAAAEAELRESVKAFRSRFLEQQYCL